MCSLDTTHQTFAGVHNSGGHCHASGLISCQSCPSRYPVGSCSEVSVANICFFSWLNRGGVPGNDRHHVNHQFLATGFQNSGGKSSENPTLAKRQNRMKKRTLSLLDHKKQLWFGASGLSGMKIRIRKYEPLALASGIIEYTRR